MELTNEGHRNTRGGVVGPKATANDGAAKTSFADDAKPRSRIRYRKGQPTNEVKGMPGKRIACLVMAVLAPAMAVTLDDGTMGSRIGVLYVGDVVRIGAFRYMKWDPLFSVSYVAANLRDFGLSLSDTRRAVRLYMPRSYEDLVGRFDVIELNDADGDAVGVHSIEMLSQGVSENGMGLVMTGGWSSFGGTGTAGPPWGETSIGRLLPTSDVVGYWIEWGRVVIDSPDNEFTRSLPWQTGGFMGSWHHNLVKVREGAVLLAHTEDGRDDPLMVTWSLEAGSRVFSLTGDTDALGLAGFVPEWEYAMDFVANIAIYLDRREVPQDVELVHRVRSKMSETEVRKSLLLNLLDFAEKLGASTRRVLAGLGEVVDVTSSASQDYLNLRFENVLEILERADGMLVELEADAVRLKNRTLVWVYVTEYAAVTGTGLLCAFVLWSLMVRRRLYREVDVTRFQ